MPAARDRYIADLIPRHIDEMAFLCGQRRAALASPRHSPRQLAEINGRIEAHLAGVFVAPPEVRRSLLEPLLGSVDRDEACAGAYALLHMQDRTAVQAVVTAFESASDATLDGLRDAFSVIHQLESTAQMQTALAHATPRTAASAAVVLANHQRLDATAPRLAALLADADPVVIALAWRAATLADVGSPSPAAAITRPFDGALRHPAASVRDAAWFNAGWSAQAWTLPALREFTAAGDAVAAHWLAVLGGDEDVALLQQAALANEDVDRRCALLARFGHPTALNALVRWMEGPDLPLAVAAGEAFKRITGVEVKGERTTLPVADDADEFTREMAPLVWLPDAAKAHSLVLLHGATWFQGSRWCEGRRLDIGVDRERLADLDMDARWDAAVRAALAGRPLAAPCPIH